MKKVIWLASLLSVMCLLVPSIVQADAVVSIVPAEIQSPAAGETITLDVEITGVEGLFGYTLKTTFDPTALSFVSVEKSDFLPGAFALDPIITDNSVEYNVTMLAGNPVDGDGVLATFEFEILEAKESTIGLEATLSDKTANAIPATIEGAEIIVEAAKEPVITEHEKGSKILTLEGVYPTANEHGHCYIPIWTGEFAIEEGMFLEYQIAMFSGNTTSQASIDMHAVDGTTLRDSGSEDQNGLSAHPNTDLSEYTGNFDDTADGDWYHRKISLDALAGKAIDQVVFAMDSNEHEAGLFRAYADNVQITDGEFRLLDVYIDGDIIQSTGQQEVTEASADGGGVVAVEGYKVYVSQGDVAVHPADKLSTTWGKIKFQ